MSSQGRKRRNRRAKRRASDASVVVERSAQAQALESIRIALFDESDRDALIAQLVERKPGPLQLPELLKLTQIVQKSHSGTLPSPEDFAQYERALAGSCDRIMSMAELQQKFVHEINRRRLDGDFGEARLGQVCAILLGLAGTAACVITAYLEADWRVSVGLGAAAIGLLVVPFLRGSR